MPVDADLIAYLDPLVGETAGTDLFEGPLGEGPDNAVAITHYMGEAAEDRVMGASLTAPGIEVARVQLMVRNTSKSSARSKALAYHALLDNLQAYTSAGGVRYFAIESLDSEPYCLGQDTGGSAGLRWRYVAHYRVEKSRG